MTHRLRHIYAPLFLIWLAFILRTHNLAAQPYTGDEAFSITQWTATSLYALLTKIARIDPQPPVALLSFTTWVSLVGHTEFAARLLSVLTGTLAVALAYAISRQLTPSNLHLHLVAAILTAINPFLLSYAQDLRPYSQWIAVNALTLWLFLLSLRSNKPIHWTTFSLFATLSILTFYLDALYLFTLNLIALLRLRTTRQHLRYWLTSQSAIIAIVSTWFLWSNVQSSPYKPTAGPPNIPDALTTLIFNDTTPAFSHLTIFSTSAQAPTLNVIFALALMTAATLTLAHNINIRKLTVLLTALLPLILLALLTLTTQKGFFRPRYLAASTLPLLLILSTLIAPQPQKRFRAYFLLLMIIPFNLATLIEYTYNPTYAKAPPWHSIAAYLRKQTTDHDIVIQNYPDPAFTYYFDGPAATTILPDTENPPASLTIAELDPLLVKYNTVWFIRVDTDFWDKRQVVATWLDANAQYIRDDWLNNMRIYQYASYQPSPSAIPNHLNYTIPCCAILAGYSITPIAATYHPQDHVTILLYWQPITQTPTDLHIFVHLLAHDGSLGAQDDHAPQNGRQHTTTWTPNILFRDVYQLTIPATIQPGTYTLSTGLYDPTTQQRQTIPPATPHAEPDGILLTTINIQNQN